MKKTRRLISTLAGVGLLFSVTSSFAAAQDSPSAQGNLKKASQSVNPIVQIQEKQKEKKQFNFFKSDALQPRNGELLNSTREYKEGEVIVKFKPNKSMQDLGVAAQTKGLKSSQHLDETLGIQVLKFDKNVSSMRDLLQFLNSARDIVEYAEPNYVLKPFAVSDPYYGNLWGLKNTGQTIGGFPGKAGIDIKAEAAWMKTKGSTATVIAVIDTGIDINHPDLKGNIWKNSGETPNDGIDNDGNGYVDDVNGWNFFDNNNDVFYSADEDYHGTHVAGTIAGRANTIGVIGVAPNVKIMPLKFIGPGYGYVADAIKAINYAKGKGVKISNNSWGGGGYSQALYDSIKDSNSLFVAAAGNSGADSDTNPMYPAAYDLSNILSVAAIDNTGNLASFSNYGATSVDVAAPGVSIFSTFPESFSYGSYGYLDGTSMATPHATGTAALITAVYPSYSPVQIKDTIMKTVTKLSSLTGKTVTGGLVNAAVAVAADVDGDIPGVPLKGTSVSSTLNASTDKDDVYSIKLLKGEKFTVSLSGTAGTDFDIYLYDKNAETVNSSVGILASSEKTGTSSEAFSFIAPDDGTYFLDVYAYQGKGSYTASVKYGVTAGVYEDKNSNLNFTGNWLQVTHSSASGGSYKVVNKVVGASVQLVFNGTGVSYRAFKDSTHGIAKVTLDGATYNVDLYSSTPQYQALVFSKTGLTAGRHVLKIEWTGKAHTGAKKEATKINVDSITVN